MWLCGFASATLIDLNTTSSIQSIQPDVNAEISANAVLVLIIVACSLLDSQVLRLAQDFENEGALQNGYIKSETKKEKVFLKNDLKIKINRQGYP